MKDDKLGELESNIGPVSTADITITRENAGETEDEDEQEEQSDNIIDEVDTAYLCANISPHRRMLVANQNYDTFSENERVVHHKLNTMLGVCGIDDPQRGRFPRAHRNSIILKSHWASHFEIGQTYTPREIIDEIKEKVLEFHRAFRSVTDELSAAFREVGRAISNVVNNAGSDSSEAESGECEVALIHPDGQLWEAEDGQYVDHGEEQFYVNLGQSEAPDVYDYDPEGWDVVCSIEDAVIFAGVVDNWSWSQTRSGEVMVEYDLVADGDESDEDETELV